MAALQLISGVKITDFDGNEEKNELLRMPSAAYLSQDEGNLANYKSYDEAPQGSIAIIPVEGAIEKNDYCGIAGSATLSQRVQDADNHPNVAAIILKVDSPGGHVDGTENFAQAVKATKKPVVAYVDGLAASAAYWIISGSDNIMLSGETAKVGSIGTMATIRDLTKYYEEMGVKIWEVYASKSTDKNKEIRDIIENGNTNTLIKDRLDPINKVFTGFVADARKDHINLQSEDVLTGKVYIGSSAIQAGLADDIGNFRAAIEKARELAGESASSSQPKETMFDKVKAYVNEMLGQQPATKSQNPKSDNPQSTIIKSDEMDFKRSLEILGKEDPTAEELGEIKAQIEQFTGANEKFTKEELDAKVADAVKEKDTELQSANDKVTELTSQVEELEAATEDPENAPKPEQEELETAGEPEEESYSMKKAKEDLGG